MSADRIAFVQGASRGIGLELVRKLLETGMASRVIASCRDPDRADELRSISAKYTPRLTTLVVDVSDEPRSPRLQRASERSPTSST
ncbi:MAG: SDR family NAD(P)-dependent oxidoreductase [Myxococcales bacterium]|nr:SDR family NAD(P)-dependent oxidoreductase [Myxococcales bacterium]